MGKNLIAFVAILLIAAIYPAKAQALDATAGASANLAHISQSNQSVGVDRRAQTLEAYLQKYNSPMAGQAQIFIDTADKYNLDWKLVVAISGVESGYGQQIPAYSYNGWGFGVYGTNVRRFSSWQEGIETVSKALRENYIGNDNKENVYAIGSQYAADPSWANKVQRYMNEIDSLYEQNQNPTLSISI